MQECNKNELRAIYFVAFMEHCLWVPTILPPELYDKHPVLSLIIVTESQSWCLYSCMQDQGCYYYYIYCTNIKIYGSIRNSVRTRFSVTKISLNAWAAVDMAVLSILGVWLCQAIVCFFVSYNVLKVIHPFDIVVQMHNVPSIILGNLWLMMKNAKAFKISRKRTLSKLTHKKYH